MRKLARSALLGAMATGVIAGAAQAHVYNAKFYFEFFGTHASNDMITIPCEATDYLLKPDVEYNLDPGVPSPMGNSTGLVIKYVPTNELNNADNIAITLHNAVFANSLTKCWLVFYENNGIDTNGDGIGDTHIDVNSDGDHGDMIVVAETRNNVQRKATIKLNVGDAGRGIPANAIYYLWCAQVGEDSLVDEYGDNASPVTYTDHLEYAPVIQITEDLYGSTVTDTCTLPGPGDKVCISATGYSCCPPGGDLLDGYTTNGEYCIIDTRCQFTLNMRSSLSIIDMYPVLDNPDCTTSKAGNVIKCYDKTVYEPGTAFVNEGGNDDIITSCSPTDRYAADGNIIINNDPDNLVDDDIVLGRGGWRGEFEASIYDVDDNYACDDTYGRGMPKGPYQALDFAHHRMYIDNSGDETTDGPNIPLNPGRACSATAEVLDTGSCTPDSDTICVLPDSTWVDDVYMGVNGKRLYWVRWGMENKLTIYSPDNDEFTVSINEEEAAKCDTRGCCYDKDKTAYFKKWEPNGDEAFAPYMLNMYEFRIVVSNNSCWDAEIYARVWDEKGRVADNVYIGTVKANSVKVLFGNRIFAKARKENPDLGRGTTPLYSVILTVGAPKRDVEFAAYDFRNGKSKMVPIYDLNAHTFTYRNVPFEQDIFEK